MALKLCKECGKEVSSVAKTCPHCGKKLKAGLIKKMLYVFGGLFALMIIGAVFGGGEGTSSKSSVAASSKKTSITLPVVQKSFIDTVDAFIGEYKAAPNELKKSAIRTNRRNAIAAVINGELGINDWVGTLKKMETNSEGKAIVSITLMGSKIRLQTWNNAFSDISGNTLIEQGTPLFVDISELSKGDKVVFSGSFLPGNADYIDEQSVTEDGAMTSPEFTLRFASIKRM